MRRFVVTVLLLTVTVGCSFQIPRVAKVPVQQGNVLTQEMINKLKPGMTRKQVAYIMGAPVLRNTFNINRWDYVHSYQIGATAYQELRVSLIFDGDVLAFFSGDLVPNNTPTPPPLDSEFDSPENDPVINDAPDA